MVFPFFECVYLNIFMREGGTREGQQEQRTEGRGRGTRGGSVFKDTPPQDNRGTENPQKIGNRGDKKTPTP